ncbi:MAG: NUDIX hydrolase [Gammaproteobacteria bacterium]|nr:MAG: NUDIX hydrolase [Gammaproteobacteria bacterium]
MVWKPRVTVAAIIEQNNRFLMVEEETSNGIAFNQPAGHLEEGETLIDAVTRETLEETAWHFRPESIIGIHLWQHPQKEETFLRVSFKGVVTSHDESLPMDDGIIQALWMSRDELASQPGKLRSPLVLSSIDDYLAGERYPLSILKSLLGSTCPNS